MNLAFSKMHGAGNDFVVIDAISQDVRLTPARVRALADRHRGIGADQILVVDAATRPDADFRYRIFNANGGEVEHCGNGARCFLRFVRYRGLSTANPLRAQINTGVLILEEDDQGAVKVDMGSASLEPSAVPFDPSGLAPRMQSAARQWPIEVAGLTVWITPVAISNPHAVIEVADVSAAPVETWGPLIERHARYLQGANVGFMEIIDPHHIRLRVYERGAGETLACGTGACAAVVAGVAAGRLNSPVKVQAPGGELQVHWNGRQLQLSGPAVRVFDGTIELED